VAQLNPTQLPATLQQIRSEKRCNTGDLHDTCSGCKWSCAPQSAIPDPEAAKNSRVIPAPSDGCGANCLGQGWPTLLRTSQAGLCHVDSRLRHLTLSPSSYNQRTSTNLESNAGHTTSAASTVPHETSTRQVIGRAQQGKGIAEQDRWARNRHGGERSIPDLPSTPGRRPPTDSSASRAIDKERFQDRRRPERRPDSYAE